MEYLVTGGGGFIGSHLVHRLVDRGRQVRVVDNFCTGKRENLADLDGRFELLEGDISDPEICRQACDGIRIVFHEAAYPSVPRSIEDPVTSHRSNVEGTFNMLLAARDAQVKRFVFAASSSAYGESPQLPKEESMATAPLSPYAAQKLTGEQYCQVFTRCYGLETLSLRYFNVFGPQQDPKSQYAAAIPAFVTSILKGEPPTVYGDGEQTRDFTFIENVISANLLAAEAQKVSGEVVNIACGDRITVNQIIRQINSLLGKDVAPNYVDPRPGDIKHSLADIRRAGEVIDYHPVVPFADGLKLAINWYANNP